MKKWYQAFFMSIFFTVYSFRDPFVPLEHSYRYTGYGSVSPVNGMIALIWIDGVSYWVKLFDVIKGHTVQALSSHCIVLQDEQGKKRTLTKKPSNLKKLKG